MKRARTVTRTGRTYGVAFKKKLATTDPYLPRGARGQIAVCEGCLSVYRNKRWYAETALTEAYRAGAAKVVCPACLKIRDDFPGGIVTLRGGYVLAHKRDILKLVKNEEERARGFNPLERVMSIRENGHGGIVISTTNEKLAQRLGRAIKKAFHGEVTYQWSHDNKLARVEWLREA
jgi:NMD protein affecting ribosome stability and mRNA decay